MTAATGSPIAETGMAVPSRAGVQSSAEITLAPSTAGAWDCAFIPSSRISTTDRAAKARKRKKPFRRFMICSSVGGQDYRTYERFAPLSSIFCCGAASAVYLQFPPQQTSHNRTGKLMTRRTQACFAAVLFYAFAVTVAAQSVYPTGTTIYDPGPRLERLYGALAAGNAGRDRHRHERQRRQAMGWLHQLRRRSRPRISGRRRHGGERSESAAPGIRSNSSSAISKAMSSGGSITTSKSKRATASTIWSARQHHDWQREDFPAGYYSPGIKPGSKAATR